jgi:hypothetical protein
MSTRQLLAEIARGIDALQKAHALVLKSEAVAPKAKITAAKTAPTKAGKVTKFPAKVLAKKAAKGGMSAEGRAKIAAAQQRRWAKVKREKNKAAKAAKAALAVSAAE